MSFLQFLAAGRFGWKVFPVTFTCILLGWIGLHELQAQQILIRTGGGENEKLEIYNQFNNFLEGKRTAAQNRLKSLLLDIDRACELSPKQKTRLEVASKGAIVSYSDKIVEKLELLAKKNGFEFKRGNPPEEDPDDEQEDDGIAGIRARVVNIGGGPNGELEEIIETEQIWESSVKKTLTEVQLEKLELWTIAKQKIIRQAAVDYLIAKADLKMFLADEQRQKLKAYVDKEYGSQLVQQMKVPPKPKRIFFAAGALLRNRDVDVDDSLKEFLSEPQLQIWKTDFQEDLD